MKKLLIKFPTRNRPEKFFNVLDRYYSMIDDIENTDFCITIDADDLTMHDDKVLDRLETYKNLYYYIGDSKSKIEAVNADLEDFTDFDIVLLASDDMIPQIQGFDNLIRENMETFFPDNDGILWFYDGVRTTLNTLCILGKKYYDRFGYIYHPDYISFFSDDEFTQIGNILRKQKFINQVIIKHEHPDIPQFKNEYDALYLKNSKFLNIDEQTFYRRKSNNFDL